MTRLGQQSSGCCGGDALAQWNTNKRLDALEARLATLERVQKIHEALPTWPGVEDCIVTAKEKAFLSNASGGMGR